MNEFHKKKLLKFDKSTSEEIQKMSFAEIQPFTSDILNWAMATMFVMVVPIIYNSFRDTSNHICVSLIEKSQELFQTGFCNNSP